MTGLFLFINPITSALLVFFALVVVLSFYLVSKLQALAVLRKELDRRGRTIDDLDQQAKLIIKGDMELKLYQQGIEDALGKLSLIRDIIASSSQVLDKEKIFLQIDEKVINSLGFKKGLFLDFEDLSIKINIGFNPVQVETVKNLLKYKKEALRDVHILPPTSEIYKQLAQDLQTKDILIAPIRVRKNTYSIVIVSELYMHAEIKKQEVETFLILCMYLSQYFDNIRLFEDLYHIKDDLEKKIKERTNELVKSLREIEEISKAKSDFISSVSHELRTPMTSVKGFSSLLVDDKFGKLPEEAKKRLEKIDDNVNKLMTIVNTLLDISRIESGKMEVKISPHNIVKLIKDVTDFLLPQTQSKGLTVTLNLPQSLNAYMDKNLIERVLINLLNNAIKFTPANGKITLSCSQDKNKATISVADTGCGMKKEDAEKIFQEFYRASNPEIATIEGSGLGLSLVKRIIDTHKEKIWVESEIDKGTNFLFTLKTVENE